MVLYRPPQDLRNLMPDGDAVARQVRGGGHETVRLARHARVVVTVIGRFAADSAAFASSPSVSGGAGVAMHRLGVELGGPTTYFGPAWLRSGHITIKQ